MKLAVIVPCHNEEITIGKVIEDAREHLPDADVYVIDNNSTDKTAEIALSKGARVITEHRQGKAFAVKKAFKVVNADIYLMIDGDDTYPLSQASELINPIKHGFADMTVGDRHSSGDYGKENKRKFHGFGNHLVKWTINLLFRSKLKDILSGYRAFSKDFVKNYPLICEGFELEADLTIHALHYNYALKEIPISFKDRPQGSDSKLNTFSDGFKILYLIVQLFKDNKPLVFFSLCFLIVFLFSLITGSVVIHEYLTTDYIKRIPMAILSASSFILSILLLICGLILDTLVKQDLKNHAIRAMNQN